MPDAAPSDSAQAARRERWLCLLAAPLVLATPFATFVRHAGLSLTSPEVLVGLATLAALGLVVGACAAVLGSVVRCVLLAALVVLFVEIETDWFAGWGRRLAFAYALAFAAMFVVRARLATILAAAFGAMLVSGLLPSPAPPIQEVVRSVPDPPAGDLPAVVHLVLDEHIGIDGIPAEFDPDGAIAARMRAGYVDRGFRVFGRAYSRYFNTTDAISNLLNFAAREEPDHHFGGAFREGQVLDQNAYFEEMSRQGYTIRVTGTNFFDLCSASPALRIGRCTIYDVESVRAVVDRELPLRSKALLVGGSFLRLSFILGGLRDALGQPLGEEGGAWRAQIGRVSTLTSMSVFDRLAGELATLERGELLFAHLILPHYPYAFEADCRLDPEVEDWLYSDAPEAAPRRNDTGSRRHRYERYLDQVQCIQSRVEALLASVAGVERLADAVVIVQGDHGSRIDRARLDRTGAFSAQDRVDDHSTLFAVRSRELAAGSDERQLPIERLLAAVVRGDPLEPAPESQVWLRGSRKVMEALALPPFRAGKVGAEPAEASE